MIADGPRIIRSSVKTNSSSSLFLLLHSPAMPRRPAQRSQSMYRRDESSPDSYFSRQPPARHPNSYPRSAPLDRSSRSLPLDRSPKSPPLDYIPPSRSASRSVRYGTPEEDDPLSADAATRIMLEKWDLLDKEHSPTPQRGRRAPTRSNSVPSMGRRKSRVREWEDWKPEMERIRLAQVEMERKLEEEAKAHQLASMEKDRQHEESSKGPGEEARRKKAIRNRKSTPCHKSAEAEEESQFYGDGGRASVISRCASTKAVRGDSEPETQERKRESRNRKREEVEPVPARRLYLSSHVLITWSDVVTSTAPSRSSRRSRRPPKPASPNFVPSKPPSPRRRDPRIASRHDTPLDKGHSTRARSAPVPYTQLRRSRSSRRKPRPTSPNTSSIATTSVAPSPASSRSPSPPRRSRSSRRRRPPSPETRGAKPTSPSPLPTSVANEPDLLSSVQDAAEQVSTAVSNAFNKVLPGFFSSTSSSK